MSNNTEGKCRAYSSIKTFLKKTLKAFDLSKNDIYKYLLRKLRNNVKPTLRPSLYKMDIKERKETEDKNISKSPKTLGKMTKLMKKQKKHITSFST